jgi:DNA mismatch repair protein MutS2
MRDHLSSLLKLEFDKIKRHIQRYSVSELGKQLLDLLHPSSDVAVILESLARVSEMKRLLEGDDPLPLHHLPDVRESLQRSSIDNFVLPGEELLKIARVLESSRLLQAFVSKRSQAYPLLAGLIGGTFSSKVLEFNIHQAIDDDGKVKDSASKELGSIRRQIIEKKDQLRSNLETVLKTIAGKEWAQEEIITTREGRMVIPVKIEHKNRVEGFVHGTSASGATAFIEPIETLDLNNEIRTLQSQEQREVEKILKQLTAQVREDKDEILRTLLLIAQIDFIHAKAKYSVEILGSSPVLKQTGRLSVVQARHPLLLLHHGISAVVPLDLEIGDPVFTLVITGPNAGGKSVALKTVGLLALLLQSGCHIPAAPESEFPVFTDIFVDVGDEQSIENDLSSFSSHLHNMKRIVESVTPTSLVLIDEIGSGTDPTEGASLAAAFLEQLTAVRSVNIVTTHHGALKLFAYEHEGMENGAMEFDQATLTPTYRFRGGLPGSSFALEMAERMQIGPGIIARARELKGAEASSIESLLIELEQRSQDLRRQIDATREEREAGAHVRAQYDQKLAALEAEIRAVRLRAVTEASEIVRNANALVEAAVKEIREHEAQPEVVRKIRQEIKHQAEAYRDTLRVEPRPESEKQFSVGEQVKLRKSDVAGEVVEILGEKTYSILVGGVRVRVSHKELEVVPKQTLPYSVDHRTGVEVTSVAAREIDLRGMYGEEAVSALEKFLDTALLSGLTRVDIIHGKGTGALRKRISEYLKKNPAVKSFRLGEWNEGGTGVTVVEL